ncbi:MAG TPA: tryptophan--tRNA ligase [Chlorobiota bacterium]|nr:tryptophan--tRNA ligase [Chlorobiota bacterium]
MESVPQRKTILSGMQPSGELTIGHIAGALRNWVRLQTEFDSLFCVVDQHAITARQVPADLRRRTLDLAAMYIAAGVEPEKSVIFIQSTVPEHSQLAWVLTCLTGMGECSRMTQFKDKSERHSDNINVGLFTYPILMAADILLYNADLVPVGEDQKQHLELARNLAERFNHHYSPTFTVPDPFIPEVGGRIMSLQEPERKMSKSDPNRNASIFLTDTDDQIRTKIRRAVTDSGSEIRYDETGRPGISNLMSLLNVATGQSFAEIESSFANVTGYASFKEAVGEALVSYIAPIRDRFLEIRADEERLRSILRDGAEAARGRARKTLRKVYKKTGFVDLTEK